MLLRYLKSYICNSVAELRNNANPFQNRNKCSQSLKERHNLTQGVSPVCMTFPNNLTPSRAVGAWREGMDGVATKTQGSRPVLFYVAPSGAYSNRSNPIQTQLEIHISSHATRDSEGGSNSRSYRHDELNNQLPSVLFRFCTHRL